MASGADATRAHAFLLGFFRNRFIGFLTLFVLPFKDWLPAILSVSGLTVSVIAIFLSGALNKRKETSQDDGTKIKKFVRDDL